MDIPTLYYGVAIIDANAEIRQSLRSLFESVHYRVECFDNAQDLLRSIKQKQPCCIVTDLRLHGMSGLELQDELSSRGYQIPLMFVTAFGDINVAVRAMKNGAVDFFTKPVNHELLLDTVNRVVKQQTLRMEKQTWGKQIKKRYQTLTPREQEVMGRMIEGKLTKEIANELNISPSTVELHRSKVMKKMQVKSIANLVKTALLAELQPDFENNY